MHIELLYIGIAFVVSCAILISKSYRPALDFIAGRTEMIQMELTNLEQEIIHLEKTCTAFYNHYILIKNKMEKMQDNMDTLLYDHKVILEKDNAKTLKRYSEKFNYEFIESIKYDVEQSLKIHIVELLLEQTMQILKEDQLDSYAKNVNDVY